MGYAFWENLEGLFSAVSCGQIRCFQLTILITRLLDICCIFLLLENAYLSAFFVVAQLAFPLYVLLFVALRPVLCSVKRLTLTRWRSGFHHLLVALSPVL